MTKLVNLIIDDRAVSVPEGTLVVDAAKKVDIDIPVFCYHPKMAPVGMCRMCLVEIGRPVIDRQTGQPVLEEDGSPKIQFGPKLETACTTPVSEGMVVLGMTERAKAGREDIVEFLLTSHPLDCPVCDKGGECPLQNLTMGFGPGESRYLYDEKVHLAKNVPLGELIWLDRERCIQCARCVRFQDELVDDPVIGFFNRGRKLEIVTFSDPGFDSYFSGNTSDICPVGALTTADFRFKARPWQLRSAASICTQCPVGCNLTLNVRREAASGGEWVVKRVMPRQHEGVNEIWICDKGRFGHHFAARKRTKESGSERLLEPMVRKNGELQAATWNEAFALIAERFKNAGESLLTLAGGRLSNEDLFSLGELTESLAGTKALYTHMAGGELTTKVGLVPGSNLGNLGKDSVILVVGSDLEEEAPIWWLRLKQAAERGATVIVAMSRPTKLDRVANYVIRYPYGADAAAVLAMAGVISPKTPALPEGVRDLADRDELKAAAKAFADAKDAVVFYGSDGMGLPESQQLAQVCANLLVTSGHAGRPNNGLVGVWPRANDQGAWELGWQPKPDLKNALKESKTVYIAAADPVGDDSAYQESFGEAFVVVQDLYLTQTARLADVVLPAQAWTEREGSYTSGERRVQRFYPALQATTAVPKQVEDESVRRAPLLTGYRPELQGPQADFAIAAYIGEQMGVELPAKSAALVFLRMAEKNSVFSVLTYQKLAETHEQWPIIGRSDLYYGGTTYENSQGLGVQLPLAGNAPAVAWPEIDTVKLPKLGLMAFPITRLYDQGATLTPSELLKERIGDAYIVLNVEDARRLKIHSGGMVRITSADTKQSAVIQALLDEKVPERVVLVPRSFGIPVHGPMTVEIRPAK
jgi:NADH-quinone oxidoreductase subunit G